MFLTKNLDILFQVNKCVLLAIFVFSDIVLFIPQGIE